MPKLSVERLVSSLGVDARAVLEEAASTAANSGHASVDIVHWLYALLRHDAGAALLGEAGVSVDAVQREVTSALADLPPENRDSLTLSPNLIQLSREAYVLASLNFGRSRVELADVLITLADDTTLRSLLRGVAPSLRGIDQAVLEKQAQAGAETPSDAGEADTQSSALGATRTRNDFLGVYTQDLTSAAQEGRIDPVIGREDELRQVIDVLMRRRQNNPILVGEAGVGKTAIAEALALEIVSGKLPERLSGVRLLSLDLGLLQAGAGVKGEFERRLRGVIDEVKASPEPIILFIDEAHTLIGAGGQAGQGDAANLLKPALARGELRTLAATTFSEYKRYIEKDAALTRRFQAVKVDEPDEERAAAMLRGIAGRFEEHHGVVIRHSALLAAIRLSARYIPDRQLPDKAISLIDTAAATVATLRNGLPDAVRAAEAERTRLGSELAWLSREPGSDQEERLGALPIRIGELDASISATRERYAAERDLARKADLLEAELAEALAAGVGVLSDGKKAVTDGWQPKAEAATPNDPHRLAELRRDLAVAERKLSDLAGDEPLAPRIVDAEVVAAVVARWTGIPVGKLLADQIAVVQSLEHRLGRRIIGQSVVLERIASAMRSSRAGLSDPRRPPAVFLLVGQSGTGKTETALALADLLYGGTQHVTTINMSEFKEEHKVSMLLGSPPGYVGYGEGGVLTEAVRRRPYGVLLLDEIDKAHPGVQDIFYQLFDKGVMRDGEGRDVDFKNTTIVMTANSASELLAGFSEDPETMPTGEALEAIVSEELKKHFKPAFLGRTTVLPYLPLDRDSLTRIVDLQIEKVATRIADRYGADFALADTARERLIAAAGTSDIGARAIEAMIARDILPVLSSFFLGAILNQRRIREITVHFGESDGFTVEAADAGSQEFVEPKTSSSERPASQGSQEGPDIGDGSRLETIS
ncbi:type VI secretion system ATPase TssH [Fulvimarina sp. MAC8]|uniref:type VI secretion system ATPase TssH n=1 Tax=Fulvimarina sp. MAC8 TaxID=3162874 RepID=UPI0032EE00BC